MKNNSFNQTAPLGGWAEARGGGGGGRELALSHCTMLALIDS